MARPIKNNAEYFTHDADMRNDVKVKALRRKFSHTGYAVWCYLLESLTDTDFFELDFNDIDAELLAADYDVSTEQLADIVEYCCRIHLLQRNEDGTRLFSEAHKRRFAGLISKRERNRDCLDSAITKRQQAKTPEKAAETPENGDYGGNNPEKAAETPENGDYGGNNPHNRVEKNRVEKNRVEKSNILYPYQDIADKWNSVCGAFLPKVQKLSESRKQKIKARLHEFGRQEAWMPTIEAIFETIAESDFLRGKNNTGWSATFDWIFENPKNWVKVLEGNYNNHKGGKPTRPQVNLGAGEYIDETGRRTYGSGKATIPNDAPPRPSERHCWDASSNQWILL